MTKRSLIPNSTQIPNFFFDFLMGKIGSAEFKCLMYIARRTYGFHREEETITINQFVEGLKNKKGDPLDDGVGLARASVVAALDLLRQSNIILVERDGKKNSYRINIDINLVEFIKGLEKLNRKYTKK